MKVIWILTALGFSTIAHASVITENTAGSLGTLTESFGESFTTPSGGPWDDITFNFFSDIPAVTPSAAGTAYLLSEAYTGTPSSLSSAVPGFIAASTGISGGAYVFAPSLELIANTTYFIYENGVETVSGGNAVAGGVAYFAPTSSTDFSLAIGPAQTANFAVDGNSGIVTAATPESSSMFLLLAGLIGLWGLANKRARTLSV